MDEPIAHKHDASYKSFFTDPMAVEGLMKGFIKNIPRTDEGRWVDEIDFTCLQAIDKSFVSRRFKKRETDLLYKAKLHGQDIYIYLLLEFQSTNDRFMALRLMRYMSELYQRLIKEDKTLKELPLVVPIVIYNGKDKWTAPYNIRDLIVKNLGEEFSILEEYIPQFKYIGIIENEIPRESLEMHQNIVSALFYLEGSTPEEFETCWKKIHQTISESSEQCRTFFCDYLQYIYQGCSPETLREIEESWREPTMLADAVRKRDKQLKLEGKREGKLQMAKRLLAKGFDIQYVAELSELSIEEISKNRGAE